MKYVDVLEWQLFKDGKPASGVNRRVFESRNQALEYLNRYLLVKGAQILVLALERHVIEGAAKEKEEAKP